MKNNSAVPRLSQGGRKGKSKTSLLPNKAKSSTSLLSRRPFSLAPNTSKRSPARRKSPPVALRTHPLRPTTAKPTPTRARVSEPFPRSSARSPAEQHRKRISLPLKLGKNLRGTKGKTVFDGLGKRGRAVASSSESGSSDSESDSGSESESGSADDQDGSRDETDETHRMDNGREEQGDTAEIGEQMLRQLKKGPLMTMHLHDAQQYANDYESCIAGSEELFIDFLGGDIAGGLLIHVKSIQTRMEDSAKLYKRQKEKLVSSGAKISQKAEDTISRLANLTPQLVSDRKATTADLQASRETMDQELKALTTKFEQTCAAIQKQAKDTSAKKGARR